MMYPRLCLLRELLRDDGVICVSIADDEFHTLRSMMDEIFGPRNFIATIVWQKKQSPQNDAINISDMHDYVVVYAKEAKQSRDDPRGWQRNLFPRTATSTARYRNPDNDPRGDWTAADFTCNKTRTERPNLYYPIVNPNTGEEVWPSERRVWLMDPDASAAKLLDNRIWWGSSGTNFPRMKKFLSEASEGIVPSTWWTREFAGDNQEARRELREMFGVEEMDFSTPKPSRLIKRIVQMATDKDSLVLDSFAGSGATGQAVLQLNIEDGGNRKVVLVEIDSAICQSVTAQRLSRVIDKVPESETGGGSQERQVAALGFRYCRLGRTLLDERGNINGDVPFADLARYVYLLEAGVPVPKRPRNDCPLLGLHRGRAIYLLYNGVLGDRRAAGGNVLTSRVLAQLPSHPDGDGPRVIYGEASRLGDATLAREQITFRQVPYSLREGA